MSCPTCDHTMAKLTQHDPICFHCERCGTVVTVIGTTKNVYVPKLISRVRQLFECNEVGKSLGEGWLGFKEVCQRCGITESINLPGDRSQ